VSRNTDGNGKGTFIYIYIKLDFPKNDETFSLDREQFICGDNSFFVVVLLQSFQQFVWIHFEYETPANGHLATMFYSDVLIW
jgi:hypothetical protein